MKESIIRAIDDSYEAMDELYRKIIHLIGEMNITQFELKKIEMEQSELSNMCIAELQNFESEIRDLFARKRQSLESFNIAFFGRTGAGKSSLIEAFRCGNGSFVSRGESDWTTDVQPVKWQGLDSCKLWDTPGVNGWGRTESRENLESKAKKAVEIADLVVVCFDSQSQQASEFNKLAAWTRDYGKPVIAIVNNRNAKWRLPVRVPFGKHRAKLSQTVREHVSNIRDELQRIGLQNVPIFAINSKRALFSRASVPFKGPDKTTMEHHREIFGTQKLLQWSNFHHISSFVSQLLESHAVEMRLGVLNKQVTGSLARIKNALHDIRIELEQSIPILEDSIDKMLGILGYPANVDPAREAFVIDGMDLLTELEIKRQGSYTALEKGDIHRIVQQHLDTKLEPLRSQSLRDGEAVVLEAFAHQKELSGERIKSRCFQSDKMETTAKEVIDEVCAYLQKKVNLVQKDSILQTELTIGALAKIKGKSGLFDRNVGVFGQGAGILAGAASAFFTVAALNSWNPLGWASFGVAAGLAVLGELFSWWGKKKRRKAESKKLRAKREALANIRKGIQDTYDQFTQSIVDSSYALRKEAFAGTIIPLARECYAAYVLLHEIKRLTDWSDTIANDIPQIRHPQHLVHNTTLGFNPQTWLGEDWIGDPEGLKKSHSNQEKPPDNAIFQQLFRSLPSGVASIALPKEASLMVWNTHIEEACNKLDDGISLWKKIQSVQTSKKVRIAFLGDYNSGKSSLIRRLLLEKGKAIPEHLKVHGRPTTSTREDYSWAENVVWVDTPGLQSSRENDEEEAYRSLEDVAFLFYVFQPNLLVGEEHHLVDIVRGNTQRGLLPRKSQSLFLLNRVDEFGIDPTDNPNDFLMLAHRKKEELYQTLSRLGIQTNYDQLTTVASNPFQTLFPGSLDDIAECKAWDGIDPFIHAIQENITALQTSAPLLSAMHCAYSSFYNRKQAYQKQQDIYEQQFVAFNRLDKDIKDAMRDGQLLSDQQKQRLLSLVQYHSSNLLQELFQADSDEKIVAQGKLLEQWWQDDLFKEELVEWQTETTLKVQEWWELSQRLLERRIQSPQFQAAISGVQASWDPEELRQKSGKGGTVFRGFENVFKHFLGKRDVVYNIGKLLGHSFKPWGAVNLAKALGKVGAVFAVIGVGFDIYDFIQTGKKEKRREQARKDAVDFIRNSSQQIIDSIIEGSEENPSPMKYLSDIQMSLKELSDGLSEQITATEQAHIQTSMQVQLLSSCLKKTEELHYEWSKS